MKALEKKIANFSLLTALRLVPPALKALIAARHASLSGFLLPGHVSAVIGKQAYDFLPEHRLPGVISGFTAEDIISSLLLLLEMHNKDIYKVMNNYPRVVRDDGNEKSRAVLAEVFEPGDAEWRGLGVIAGSGLRAAGPLTPPWTPPPLHHQRTAPRRRKGCRCGDVLRGLIDPPACPLFNKACRPDQPLGPCMVSIGRQLQRLGDLWIRYCWPTAAAAARAPS